MGGPCRTFAQAPAAWINDFDRTEYTRNFNKQYDDKGRLISDETFALTFEKGMNQLKANQDGSSILSYNRELIYDCDAVRQTLPDSMPPCANPNTDPNAARYDSQNGLDGPIYMREILRYDADGTGWWFAPRKQMDWQIVETIFGWSGNPRASRRLQHINFDGVPMLIPANGLCPQTANRNNYCLSMPWVTYVQLPQPQNGIASLLLV